MSSGVSAESRIQGGLWGAAVGDALGVPVEFCDRAARKRDPVRDLRGYGTHNQAPGTWSLTLCTVDSLLQVGEDYQALANSFVAWSRAEIWTPRGMVFDIGIATADAVRSLARGTDPLAAGRTDEHSNGNGSLMRIVPVAMWFAGRGVAATVYAAHKCSALTHRHPRSQVGCGIYCLIAQHLLDGANAASAIDSSWKNAAAHYDADPFVSELRRYAGISPSSKLRKLQAHEVKGSGYLVDTLEASLWCLLTTNSFREAVLKAVNLGDDTDTTAAVTGALAGMRYGVDRVPPHWRASLARDDELESLFDAFAARVCEKVHIGKRTTSRVADRARQAKTEYWIPEAEVSALSKIIIVLSTETQNRGLHLRFDKLVSERR